MLESSCSVESCASRRKMSISECRREGALTVDQTEAAKRGTNHARGQTVLRTAADCQESPSRGPCPGDSSLRFPNTKLGETGECSQPRLRIGASERTPPKGSNVTFFTASPSRSRLTFARKCAIPRDRLRGNLAERNGRQACAQRQTRFACPNLGLVNIPSSKSSSFPAD